MEPYVGLGHFTEDFADRFFGRDTECSLIIGNLRAARLTLLYAESGVGKSSLLRAGVVARLHGFAEHDVEVRGRPRLVPVVFSSWSEAPVAGLVRALAAAVRPYLDDGAELDLPEDDLERALELASAALEATLLVVLDQFEEYFLYPELGPEEEHVAAQIARCVTRPDLRANFLISIREDSYARLGDLFRGKLTNVYANFLHLDFLGRVGARESIEKPIERVNELSANGHHYELEPALVEAVLDQVGRGQIEAADEDGQHDGDDRDEIETTYLQLVMRRLWEEETGAGSDRLRLATLEQLGGSQAVITSHLDRAMEDETEGGRLTPEQRLVAASIFHFLVTSGGTKIALTAQDLADLSGRPRAEIEPVLHHLSSPALHILRPVVSENGQGEPRFEIFHDALARPIVEWRTRVEEEERDARLKRERAEKERAQQAAAEAERKTAVERRRKRAALVLLGLLIIVFIVGIFVRQGEAEQEREAATQSVRASTRLFELDASPTFGPAAAALAGVEAYRLSPTNEARGEVLRMLQYNPGLATVAVGHTQSLTAVSFWPGSTNFATASRDETVRLWDAGGEELISPRVGASDTVDVAVSPALPDGSRLLAGASQGGDLRLWKLGPDGEVERKLSLDLYSSFSLYPGEPLSGGVEAVAFNPRVPTMLAVAGGMNSDFELLDLSDLNHPKPLGQREALGVVADLAFSPDGRTLLAATFNGGQAWELTRSGLAPAPPRKLMRGDFEAVAAAPDGSWALGSWSGIHVWDAVNHRSRYMNSGTTSLAFARDGRVLVSGSSDWNVMTWDVASGRPFGPPRATNLEPVADVAVSSDGKTIAAAGEDGFVRLWPLAPRHALAVTVGGLGPEELGVHRPTIRDSAVSGDGQLVAAAGARSGTTVWELTDLDDPNAVREPLFRIPGFSAAVAYHADLLAVPRGHSFVLWSTAPDCPTMPEKPCRLAAPSRPHSEKGIAGMDMAMIGGRLVLASSGYKEGDAILNLWDVTDAQRSGEVTFLSTRRMHGNRRAQRDTSVKVVALSSASRFAAVGAKDGKMRVWDITDPRTPVGIDVSHARGNESQAVSALAFSADGEWLASGGDDQQVVFWKVTRPAGEAPTVQPTPGTLFQSQSIVSLAFSPDGDVIAVGDAEGAACLYGMENRDVIGGCMIGHYDSGEPNGGAINSLDFVPVRGHGAYLLSTGVGQPIVAWKPLLWNRDDSDEVEARITAAVCALAGRDLRRPEWSAIFESTMLADDREPTCS